MLSYLFYNKNDLTKISQFYIEFADFQFTVFFTKFTTTMYRKKNWVAFFYKLLRKLANTNYMYYISLHYNKYNSYIFSKTDIIYKSLYLHASDGFNLHTMYDFNA